MIRVFRYITLSVLFIIIQTTIANFLAIRDIVPDILIVWIVYLAIREGQITATVAGFLIGGAMDLLAGGDGMLGLSALTKTVAGFCAGYFYNENKILQTLGGYYFLIAIGVAAFLHNTLYFIIFLQGTGIDVAGILLLYGFPATLYTTAVGLFPMFAFARKMLS
ncbi:MAG: hypothetical protein ACKVRP_08500 [Bacteroidota bacterium]